MFTFYPILNAENIRRNTVYDRKEIIPMGIRRVTDPAKIIDRIYSEGRSDGRSPPAKPRAGDGSYGLATGYEQPDPKQQAVQTPDAKHGPGYDNDVKKNWLRGYGKPHPHFDSGKSGDRYRK
jgi:hypothetical protein